MYRIKNSYSFYSNGGIFLRWNLDGRVFDDLDDVARHLALFESVRGRIPDDWVIEKLIPAEEAEPGARELLEEFREANEDEEAG